MFDLIDINGPGHAKMCHMPYANNKCADQPAHLLRTPEVFGAFSFTIRLADRIEM